MGRTSDNTRILQGWIKQAEKLGWRVEHSTRLVWRRPDGTVAASSAATPGAHPRNMMNIRARLRRAGVPI